jgi:hypothetical protein
LSQLYPAVSNDERAASIDWIGIAIDAEGYSAIALALGACRDRDPCGPARRRP